LTTCSNGHPVRVGSVFCGACGVEMRTSCINGHLNQPETLFCETCGTALSVLSTPLALEDVTPLLVTPTTLNSDNFERFETASPPIPNSESEVNLSEAVAQTRPPKVIVHRCSMCAKTFGTEVNFCPSCGAAINVTKDEQSPNPEAFRKFPTSDQKSEALRKFGSEERAHDDWKVLGTVDPTVTTISSEDSAVAEHTGDVAAGQDSSNLGKGHRVSWRRLVLGVGSGTLVIIICVASVVFLERHSSAQSATTIAIPATTTDKATVIRTSVFGTVGVTSRATPVVAPIALSGQPLLTGVSNTGNTLPEVFYVGAEYCPYCAAETWSTIVALDRFGSFKGLRNTTSAAGDIYPNTPSFTFVGTTYSSKYLAFRGVELFNNVMSSASGYYTPLQKLSASEDAIFKKYDTSNYIPGTTSALNGSIPFISIGNKFLVSGASYSPTILKGLTRSHIAAELNNPANPVTQAIITTANYETATFCVLTKEHPGNVCESAGVLAATRALGA